MTSKTVTSKTVTSKTVTEHSQIVAFSGGKDSTAMALRMAELGDPFKLLFTATGDELPEVYGHIDRVVEMTGAELVKPPGPGLSDCALCYGQRLGEWYMLWKLHPEAFARGEQLEGRIGHTFRSPGRDTWPAALKDLRAEFERGRQPRGLRVIQDRYSDDEEVADEGMRACRVCRL